MDGYELLTVGGCDRSTNVVLTRDRYARLVSQSSDFIEKIGYYHLHNAPRDENPAGDPVRTAPWAGLYRLDQFVVPKGSVLDITSVIFSMRADPTFPISTTGFVHNRNAAIGYSQADSEIYGSFSDGITLDDHFLDPEYNRFLIKINSRIPFSQGYLRRAQTITWGLYFPEVGTTIPEDELTLSRYSGYNVMNRNALTQGDLSFHLIAREEQVVEFFFETEAATATAIPGGVTVTVNTAIPKADAIVEWCGRLIPKTVFEEVIKATQ